MIYILSWLSQKAGKTEAFRGEMEKVAKTFEVGFNILKNPNRVDYYHIHLINQLNFANN
jgi:hypothetical protein